MPWPLKLKVSYGNAIPLLYLTYVIVSSLTTVKASFVAQEDRLQIILIALLYMEENFPSIVMFTQHYNVVKYKKPPIFHTRLIVSV